MKRWKRAIVLASLLLACAWVGKSLADHEHHDGPKVIYIIRHAEKPDASDDPNLAPRGYERAKALVHVIPDRFATPDFIFASAVSRKSRRPIETVTPLAESLHMKIDDRFKDADYAALATELLGDPKYAGKTILVCWHHGEIPGLARDLGADDAPDHWAPDSFDRVWVLTYDHDKVSFANLPQKALPGDSP